MNDFPEKLFDFGYYPRIDDHLQELSEKAEEEDWNYQHTETNYTYPVLYNYIRYTYKRISEEGKISVSADGQYACWNTGLVTSNQEPIFSSFELNSREEAQPWFFKGWFRPGEWQMNIFEKLPDIAHYFDSPSSLVLDSGLDFRVNAEHIIADNKERFPAPFADMADFQLQTILKGAIENAKLRVRRNYKAAIPQYYNGKIQLLLPLCLSDARRADLALVAEKYTGFYRCSTCLTLDMAYNNARQLARPDRDWLQP